MGTLAIQSCVSLEKESLTTPSSGVPNSSNSISPFTAQPGFQAEWRGISSSADAGKCFRRSDVTAKLTAKQIAEWMLDELKRKGELYQEALVDEIANKFGIQFTYTNDNGNMAIGHDVLSAFRKLTKDSVVWHREDRLWRMRKPDNEPSRQQN